ncbi:hypothetical protein NDU88_002738 [Pleurodeles waltl]|uniref:Uncharacterized protein n=1 Tax=Pleurodeles waltl TaxID=8319 RepID=A0AAV7Q7J2_PLEWA|nr:hypothetical protein NDU88_002738 [Pleurodeles waltl]
MGGAKTFGSGSGESGGSLEESLVEALDSNVQLSINEALAKALGPLTSHLKGFARQQGWLPSIAAAAETPSQPAKPSKVKAKTKKWAHSEAFERLSGAVLEERGYSNSRAQEATSDNSEWVTTRSKLELEVFSSMWFAGLQSLLPKIFVLSREVFRVPGIVVTIGVVRSVGSINFWL